MISQPISPTISFQANIMAKNITKMIAKKLSKELEILAANISSQLQAIQKMLIILINFAKSTKNAMLPSVFIPAGLSNPLTKKNGKMFKNILFKFKMLLKKLNPIQLQLENADLIMIVWNGPPRKNNSKYFLIIVKQLTNINCLYISITGTPGMISSTSQQKIETDLPLVLCTPSQALKKNQTKYCNLIFMWE